jgi:hypothetical protein
MAVDLCGKIQKKKLEAEVSNRSLKQKLAAEVISRGL